MSIDKLFKSFQAVRRPYDILALFLLAGLLLWRPDYLHQELNLFEYGLYLPGIDAISQGQVPFRDFFHLRGPFELYLPVLFMKVFGFRLDVLASYFYVGTALTMFIAILLAYELVEQRLLLYPFVLILVTRTFPRVVFTSWGGMRYVWGLLAVWCLVRFLKNKRLEYMAAAGALAAIGFLTSIEIGVIVLAAFTAFMVLGREYRRFAWIFIGGFLGITLPYGVYLLSQHAFLPYVQAQWVVVTHMQKTFVQMYRIPDTPFKFLHAIFFPFDKSFYQMTPMYTYIFFFSLYFWRIFYKKSTALDHAALVVAMYGLVSFLTSFRNLWFVEYEMALQPEKIVLFYLLGQLIKEGQEQWPKLKWLGVVLLTMVVISSLIYGIGRFKTRFYKFSWVHQSSADRLTGKEELINGALLTRIDLPRIQYMSIPVWQAQDLQQLHFFIDTHVAKQEAVLMYSELGSLHFILDRPWVGHFPMVTMSWMNEEWFNDYMKTLESNPPRYAIVNKEKDFYFSEPFFSVPANRIKHQRIMQFLSHYYVIEDQTPSYLIYRLRTGQMSVLPKESSHA